MHESEKWKWSHSVVSNSSWPHGLQPTRLLRPWDFPGKSTGVHSLSFFQGIFPTQGSNPGLLHCRQIFYQLNHQGSPRILEWVAYHFSSRSSRSRSQTRVSCIADGFFTSWDTREALEEIKIAISNPLSRTSFLEKKAVRKLNGAFNYGEGYSKDTWRKWPLSWGWWRVDKGEIRCLKDSPYPPRTQILTLLERKGA